MGKYKLFIETNDCFSFNIAEFDEFDKAKNEMQRMIKELLSNYKLDYFNGLWEEFKDEMPDNVKEILSSYEQNGFANFIEKTYGTTNNYEYQVGDSFFWIFDIVGEEAETSINLESNFINSDINLSEEYYFKIHFREELAINENISIILKAE